MTPRDPTSGSEPGEPTPGDPAPSDPAPAAPDTPSVAPLIPWDDGRGSTPGPSPEAQPQSAPPSGSRPGTSTFTIEGRSAPGLFVVGWLGTLVGLGLIVVGFVASDPTARVAVLLLGSAVLSVGLIAGAGSQGIERRRRGTLPYQGPSPFLVFAAVIPVSVLASVLVGIPLAVLGVPLDGPVGALAGVTAQALVYVALIRLLVVDTGALSWAAMGVRRLDGAALREILWGAPLAFPVIVATIPVAVLLQAIFPVTPVSPLPPTGEAVGFAISLLAGVIVAPLGEEILFRGFTTTAWAKAFGARRGLIQAALLFAFAHVLTISGATAGDAFGQAVVGFGTRIPVALALGWIFLRSGTIWASFGLHAAFNATLLVIAEIGFRST